ncbi:MAG: phage holin family protein [Nitrospira sp.]
MTAQEETRSSRNGLFGLLMGLVGDVRTLIRQELQLMRDEFHAETKKACQAAVSIGVGIGLTLIGGIFALIMIVHMLHQFANLPLWACYGAIGIVLLAVGALLLVNATQALQNFNLIPRRTLHSLKEDAQCIKDHIPSNKI